MSEIEPLEKVIERSAFINLPHHYGAWEVDARMTVSRASDIVRLLASGNLRGARTVLYDLNVGINHLITLVEAAQQREPLRYTCYGCGKTWNGPDALTKAIESSCYPYDDEVRPKAHHTYDDFRVQFDR